MANGFKKGGGNKPQPYIPKGNGEKSGQYAKNQAKDDYLVSESCTKRDLLNALSEEEFISVNQYTDIRIGKALNKAIRENRMTESDKKLKDRLISAISKHKLKSSVSFYRGITVSQEVYEKSFLLRFLLDLPAKGSLICSTSRAYSRAVSAAKTRSENEVGIVFCGELPKGYSALPIEGISNNAAEKEILITAPLYQIEEITNCVWNGLKFKRIEVKILGDENHEN